jgi:hypothetical protein
MTRRTSRAQGHAQAQESVSVAAVAAAAPIESSAAPEASPAAEISLAEQELNASNAILSRTERLTTLTAEIASCDAQLTAAAARLAGLESDLSALPARLASAQADLLINQSPAAHARVAELERLRTDGESTLVAERATRETLQATRERLLAEQQETEHLLPELAQRQREIHRARGEALRDSFALQVVTAAARVEEARLALDAATEAERQARRDAKHAIAAEWHAMLGEPATQPLLPTPRPSNATERILETYIRFLETFQEVATKHTEEVHGRLGDAHFVYLLSIPAPTFALMLEHKDAGAFALRLEQAYLALEWSKRYPMPRSTDLDDYDD